LSVSRPKRDHRLGLALVLAFGFAAPNALLAQGSDLQRQISESRLRLEEIRAERARLQAELDDARGGMRDASRELANIERQLSASRSVLAELELQLRMAENETDDNSRSLLVTRDRHLEATAVLHRRLREVYKLGALHTVRVLLGADSFADLLNRYRYVQMIATYDRALVERVGRLESDLQARDDELHANMIDLGRLRQAQLVEVSELRSVESQRQDAISNFRGAENRALSRLDTLGRDGQRMQGLIDDLEERRLEAERRNATASRPAPTSSTAPSTAAAGSLDWPVTGRILYRFGVERRPNGTTLRWNGIGIGALPGTPVQAVRAGTVVLAGPFEGYGPTVVLSHGDGFYTLYLYLEDIGVVEGRRVEMGQVVGTVGGRDTPEGPHIEFQIRNPQAQDPLPWLRTLPDTGR
jgi:septal ring factor EnvC (AmiA/AmiB activator)